MGTNMVAFAYAHLHYICIPIPCFTMAGGGEIGKCEYFCEFATEHILLYVHTSKAKNLGVE